MKSQLKIFVIGLLIFTLNPTICFAQGSDFPDSPEGGDDPLLDPAPLNDYIWILIILAFILGIYALQKKKSFQLKNRSL